MVAPRVSASCPMRRLPVVEPARRKPQLRHPERRNELPQKIPLLRSARSPRLFRSRLQEPSRTEFHREWPPRRALLPVPRECPPRRPLLWVPRAPRHTRRARYPAGRDPVPCCTSAVLRRYRPARARCLPAGEARWRSPDRVKAPSRKLPALRPVVLRRIWPARRLRVHSCVLAAAPGAPCRSLSSATVLQLFCIRSREERSRAGDSHEISAWARETWWSVASMSLDVVLPALCRLSGTERLQ